MLSGGGEDQRDDLRVQPVSSAIKYPSGHRSSAGRGRIEWKSRQVQVEERLTDAGPIDTGVSGGRNSCAS